MEDTEILLVGLFVGFLFNLGLTHIQEYYAGKRQEKQFDYDKEKLKIQLNYEDKKKACLKLRKITNESTGIEWVKNVEELLKSSDGLFLEDIRPKLENRIEIIRKDWERDVYSIKKEEGKKIIEKKLEASGISLEQWEDIQFELGKDATEKEMGEYLRMDPISQIEYDYKPKIENAEKKLNKKVKNMNKDILMLIKEKMEKI